MVCRIGAGLLGVLCLVAAGCGGAAAPVSPGGPDSLSLPWPPPAAVARGVSASSNLNGADYSTKNDASTATGTQLAMEPDAGKAFGFAVYTFPALPDGADLLHVDVSAGITDGGQVFVGLSNYTRGAWEWFATTAGSFSYAITSSSTYLSPGRAPSIAVIYYGESSATVHLIALETSAPALQPPTGLAGESAPNQIDLTWDAVADATGYLVERSFVSAFTPYVQLTATAITATTYSDTEPGEDRMCYYRVIAVNDTGQSAPCDPIDIHAPESDLPMPTNFRVTAASLTSVTVKWDYSGSMPSNFEILLAEEPDQPLGLRAGFTPGFIKYDTIEELEPGATVYLRVVALDSHGWRGVATDDLAATTKTPWSWGTPVVIANGTGPVAVCQTPTGLAAAYNGAGGMEVAQNSGSGWTTSSVTSNTTEDYLDIAANDDGNLCAALHTYNTDDLGVGVYNGTTWNYQRVHGAGTTGQGHDKSGYRCQVAAGDGEFWVVHYDQTGFDFLIHHTAISPVAWDTTTLNADKDESACGVGYNGANPCAFIYDAVAHQLKFATSADSWTFSQALPSANDNLGESFNVCRIGTDWVIPALDAIAEEVYLVSGSAAPLSVSSVGTMDEIGIMFTNVVEIGGVQAFAGYRSTTGWHFVDHSSGWVIQEIDLPSATLGPNLDLGVMNDLPVIVFADPASNSIKACTGIPPQ